MHETYPPSPFQPKKTCQSRLASNDTDSMKEKTHRGEILFIQGRRKRAIVSATNRLSSVTRSAKKKKKISSWHKPEKSNKKNTHQKIRISLVLSQNHILSFAFVVSPHEFPSRCLCNVCTWSLLALKETKNGKSTRK